MKKKKKELGIIQNQYVGSKNREKDHSKKEPIRSVNNSELEMSLNEIDPKN